MYEDSTTTVDMVFLAPKRRWTHPRAGLTRAMLLLKEH